MLQTETFFLFFFSTITCELGIVLFDTGHAFNDQDRCVCAGYDNGDIKLFDLRNMSLRWETNVKNGVRNWSSTGLTWIKWIDLHFIELRAKFYIYGNLNIRN